MRISGYIAIWEIKIKDCRKEFPVAKIAVQLSTQKWQFFDAGFFFLSRDVLFCCSSSSRDFPSLIPWKSAALRGRRKIRGWNVASWHLILEQPEFKLHMLICILLWVIISISLSRQYLTNWTEKGSLLFNNLVFLFWCRVISNEMRWGKYEQNAWSNNLYKVGQFLRTWITQGQQPPNYSFRKTLNHDKWSLVNEKHVGFLVWVYELLSCNCLIVKVSIYEGDKAAATFSSFSSVTS